MNASQQRRLTHLTLGLEQQWLAAWEAWFLALVIEWRRINPQVSYDALRPYEEEWTSLSTAEERAGFLSRGASLCVLHGLPPDLWAWFWQDVYGPVLDGDLTLWPRLIPEPPDTPSPAEEVEESLPPVLRLLCAARSTVRWIVSTPPGH